MMQSFRRQHFMAQQGAPASRMGHDYLGSIGIGGSVRTVPQPEPELPPMSQTQQHYRPPIVYQGPLTSGLGASMASLGSSGGRRIYTVRQPEPELGPQSLLAQGSPSQPPAYFAGPMPAYTGQALPAASSSSAMIGRPSPAAAVSPSLPQAQHQPPRPQVIRHPFQVAGLQPQAISVPSQVISPQLRGQGLPIHRAAPPQVPAAQPVQVVGMQQQPRPLLASAQRAPAPQVMQQQPQQPHPSSTRPAP